MKNIHKGVFASIFSLSFILISVGLIVLISCLFSVQNVDGATFIARNSTDRGSLDISVEQLNTQSDPEVKDLFKISFFRPHTQILQEHVDYNFLILKDNKVKFQYSNETGQPQIPLHTYNGEIEVPILGNHNLPAGQYVIKIPIYAILFNPLKTEIAEFKFNLTSKQ